MMQYDINFSGSLTIKAQQGIAAADAHADAQWRHVIDAAIVAVARRLPRVTTDDVYNELLAINGMRKAQGKLPVDTHHLCAIGGAMIRARKLGIISPTNEVKRSEIPHKHGNLMRVWRSNFYEGKA